MEAVRNNMMDMVKVLIYATDDRKVWETKETTLVDLALQDKDGKSVIHHCVQNREVKIAYRILKETWWSKGCVNVMRWQFRRNYPRFDLPIFTCRRTGQIW